MTVLTRLSLANRALIALLAVVVIVFGLVATRQLKQELLPPIEFPQAVVLSTYEGASPQAVESEVTEPLENALAGVSEVEGITSTSSTGSSQIVVETTYGTDSDDVVRSLQRATAQVESQLPDGVEPQVMTGSLDDFPVVVTSVTSDEDADQLAERLESVAVPRLKDVPGVREAAVSGQRAQQVSITLRADDIEDEGVSVDEIAQLLNANGVSVSAGALRDDGGERPVQVGTRLQSVDALQDLVVSGADGPVRLDAVADVEMVDEEQTTISRTNGQPALSISITKTPDANTVEVSHGVAAALDEVSGDLGGSVEFTTVFDQAPFIEQSIEDLAKEGGLGLIFAILAILVFLLSVRATVITAVSIPLSLLIALVGLWAGGYSLNLLTLAALTVAVGRVVDDSIVVVEAIRRHHSLGTGKWQSIMGGVKEVAGAITASTFTTVAVFLPLAFVQGEAGELFRPFAVTSSIALLASLFVALTIVPVLAYWFLQRRASRVRLDRAAKKDLRAERRAALREWRTGRKHRRKQGGGTHAAGSADVDDILDRSEELRQPVLSRREARREDVLSTRRAIDEPPTRLQKSYLPVLRFTTAHPVITIIVAVVVFAGTLAMTPLLKTDYIGDAGDDSLIVTQELPEGTELQETSTAAEQVEGIFADDPDVESYQLTIGGDGFMAPADTNIGTFTVTLRPGADSAVVSDRLAGEFGQLGEDAGEVELASGGAFGSTNAMSVQITAVDADVLNEATDQVTEALNGVEGLSQVSNDLQPTQPLIEVRVDHEEAQEEGFTEAEVGQIVSRAMRGQELGNVVIDDITRVVRLYSDTPVETVQQLRELELPISQKQIADAQEEAAEEAAAVPQQPTAPDAGQDPGAAAPVEPSTDPADLDIDPIELQDVATVEEITTAPSVTRVDGQRAATVTGELSGDDVGAATTAVTTELDTLDLPDGASTDIGGVSQEQQESFQQLGLAILIAILAVFVIMVGTFRSFVQPLVLLVSIPFTATGAIGALLLTDTALGVPSLIGILMLIGIVVTNAIVLIDLINQYRRDGVPLREAVIHGARLRYRPIIMTAFATICALIPMAIGLTGGGIFISAPLAIVVIGGLVSSTILTLVVVPVLYVLVEGVKERRAERSEVKHAVREAAISRTERRQNAEGAAVGPDPAPVDEEHAATSAGGGAHPASSAGTVTVARAPDGQPEGGAAPGAEVPASQRDTLDAPAPGGPVAAAGEPGDVHRPESDPAPPEPGGENAGAVESETGGPGEPDQPADLARQYDDERAGEAGPPDEPGGSDEDDRGGESGWTDEEGRPGGADPGR